jgi:molybdopterin-binding protein
MLRWTDSGRIGKTTDSSGRHVIDGAELAEFARERAESAATAEGVPVAAQSVRNRFTGLVTRVIKDTVMAQVEIQAGPHRFVSLLTREAADELGLEPGMLATAAVKATNVAVEIPATIVRRGGPTRGTALLSGASPSRVWGRAYWPRPTACTRPGHIGPRGTGRQPWQSGWRPANVCSKSTVTTAPLPEQVRSWSRHGPSR